VPLEAAKHEGYLDACSAAGLHNIITLSPASTPERLHKNAAIASGLVYCMARQGITGAGGGLHPEVQQYLTAVRTHIHLPIALGFGISTPERFQAVAPHCDIAVVGSAIINVISQSKPESITTNVKQFLTQLTTATIATSTRAPKGKA
jgi:tryptophan synthase alpha chain